MKNILVRRTNESERAATFKYRTAGVTVMVANCCLVSSMRNELVTNPRHVRRQPRRAPRRACRMLSKDKLPNDPDESTLGSGAGNNEKNAAGGRR